MSRCDLVAICGMPRAGTTFLHDLFACGKLGRNFFAQHSKTPGPHFPLSTHEPKYLNLHYLYDIPIEPALMEMIRYWRGQVGDPDTTIIYKHPQLIFHGPIFEEYLLRVKYVFCFRAYDSWAESVHRYTGGGDGIARMSMGSIYHKFWGQDWEQPENLQDRYRYLWGYIQENIAKFKKQLPPQQYADFIYENPAGSLVSIFAMLGIREDPQEMVSKYLRTRDI